jgi:hypothetical protein
MAKTESEVLFESFCDINRIPWVRVEQGDLPTPDYVVTFPGTGQVYFEIKQIDEDPNFRALGGVSTRTVGNHVRSKIDAARAQMKVGANLGAASVLLIHNHLDPLQLFGTERHDFLTAMYGEMTVFLKNGRIADSFHGRNAKLRKDNNVSFSAVGHLQRSPFGPVIEMYENVFAQIRLDVSSVPECFGILRVEIVESAA